MSNGYESNNPADLAAEIIKKRAAETGLELTDDFEERIAEARAYCDLEIDCDALRDKDARLLSRAMGGHIESRELPDGAYEHTVKETPMQWTTEYPTKPGFYWVRNYVRRWTRSNIHPGPELVQLVPWELAPEAGWRVLGVGYSGVEIHGIASAEWYGPIDPPE